MATQSKFFADLGIKSATHTEVDGNLTIAGNLTVQGTQTIIDSTTSSVVDSMMELASGNTTADLLDIGFYGNYNDGLSGESGVSEYTGFFRDASDSTWKLFDGLEVEPTTTVNLSGDNYALADLLVGDLTATTITATNGLTGNSITFPTSDGTNGQVIKTNGSGTLSFTDMSSGADGITASGSNTIIQSPDDTNVIHVNNSAQVGIGVTDSDAKLEIKGSGGGTGLAFKTTDASSNEVFYVQDGGRAGLNYYPFTIGIPSGTASASGARFQVEEAGFLTVLNTGNVGIGRPDPASILHIHASQPEVIISNDTQDGTSTLLRLCEDFDSDARAGGFLRYNGSANKFEVGSHISGTDTVAMTIPRATVGICFGTDTAAANQLDDYEEGTFTPSYTVGGGGSVTGVTSTNIGTYTKVGRMVTVTITSVYVQTSGTIPTYYTVSLPFSAGSTGGLQGFGFGQETGQSGAGMMVHVANSATTAIIWKYNGGAVPANSYFSFGFTYQTA